MCTADRRTARVGFSFKQQGGNPESTVGCPTKRAVPRLILGLINTAYLHFSLTQSEHCGKFRSAGSNLLLSQHFADSQNSQAVPEQTERSPSKDFQSDAPTEEAGGLGVLLEPLCAHWSDFNCEGQVFRVSILQV